MLGAFKNWDGVYLQFEILLRIPNLEAAVCCMQFNLWMCHCLDWCVYCSIFEIKLTVSMISRKRNFHFDKWTKTKIVENLRGTVSKFPYPQALICFLCACMQMIIHTRQRNTMVMIPFFLIQLKETGLQKFLTWLMETFDRGCIDSSEPESG